MPWSRIATSSWRPRADPMMTGPLGALQSATSTLGDTQSRANLYSMSLQLRHIVAAVVLCVALLAPALASAHAGHSHHGAAAAVEPAAVPAAEHVTTEHVAGAPKSSPSILRREIARASVPTSNPDISDCASHCCGGTANMTCCAAALSPEISVIPSATSSHTLVFARAGALLGLPPEALPKPPKSFA